MKGEKKKMERKEYLKVFFKAEDVEEGVDEAVAMGYRVKLISQSMIPSSETRSENYRIHYALAVVFEPDPDYKEFPHVSGPIDPDDWHSQKK